MEDEQIKNYLNKHYLHLFVSEKENEILKAYKEFCELHPYDKEADKEWEEYSFWSNARRSGKVMSDRV